MVTPSARTTGTGGGVVVVARRKAAPADLPDLRDSDDGSTGGARALRPAPGRCYAVRIVHSPMSPATLMETVEANLNDHESSLT